MDDLWMTTGLSCNKILLLFVGLFLMFLGPNLRQSTGYRCPTHNKRNNNERNEALRRIIAGIREDGPSFHHHEDEMDGPVSTASRCFYLDLTIVMFGTHIVNLALHKRAKRSGKQTQIGEAAALHPIIMVRPWFVHVSAFGLVREEKKRTYTSACQKLRNPFIG